MPHPGTTMAAMNKNEITDALRGDLTLPAAYGYFLLSLLRERGHDEAALLAGTGLGAMQLQDQRERIAGWQYAAMLANALRLDGDPGIAYELGLRSQLTKHGFVGFGLMSCATLRDAITLGQRYLQARVPLFHSDIGIEGDEVVIDLREAVSLGPLHTFTFDIVLVELCCLFSRLVAGDRPPRSWRTTIHVPYPEPAHYARYRERLPRFLFDREATQIRFPALLLDQPIATADPLGAQMAIAQCEQELASQPRRESLAAQVRARLVCRGGSYPDLARIAEQLHLSTRTLKRRLQEEASGFQDLLDEARTRDSLRLLANPAFSVDQVARAVGYGDPANFTRAFRKWTGLSPRDWRQRQATAGDRPHGPI